MPSRRSLQQAKDTDTLSQSPATAHAQATTIQVEPTAIIQRASIDPRSLSRADVLQLQRTIGNRAVGQLLGGGSHTPWHVAPGGDSTTARSAASEGYQPNNTGLPDNLKAGIEELSGQDMSHVRVHFNSSRPAQLEALAYTKGTEIHVAPGQERHCRMRPGMWCSKSKGGCSRHFSSTAKGSMMITA